MGGVGFSPRSWNHLPVAAKNTAPPCIINISLCLFLVLGLHPKASDPIYTSLPIYILPSKVSLTHCHSKAWDHMSMVALVKENPMVTWIKKLTNSHMLQYFNVTTSVSWNAMGNTKVHSHLVLYY